MTATSLFFNDFKRHLSFEEIWHSIKYIPIYEVKKKVDLKISLTVEQFLKKNKGKMKKILNQLWGIQADEVTLKRVSESLIGTSGMSADMEIAMTNNLIEWGNLQYNPMAVITSMQAGNVMMGDINNAIGSNLFFDITHPEVVNFIKDETATLIVEMNEQLLGGIRTMVQFAVENNLTRNELKMLLEKSVSLTKRESQWVMNRYVKTYEQNLKRLMEIEKQGVRQARKGARAIVQRNMARHTRKLKDSRIERIARTEFTRLKNKVDMESLQQAIESGKLKGAQKTWRRTGYNDNWPSSIANDGQTVRVDGVFNSGDSFPGEINERCILEYSLRV